MHRYHHRELVLLHPAALRCGEIGKYQYIANVAFCFSDFKISKSEIATKAEASSPTISPVCAADVYITDQTPVRGKI
jgi:hypothetical protein